VFKIIKLVLLHTVESRGVAIEGAGEAAAPGPRPSGGPLCEEQSKKKDVILNDFLKKKNDFGL